MAFSRQAFLGSCPAAPGLMVMPSFGCTILCTGKIGPQNPLPRHPHPPRGPNMLHSIFDVAFYGYEPLAWLAVSICAFFGAIWALTAYMAAKG